MKKNGNYIVYEVCYNTYSRTFLNLKNCVDYAERIAKENPKDTIKVYRTEYSYLFDMWLEDTRLIWICNKSQNINNVREYLK